jgi:exodeoxyribonuclease VII small subunit
MTEPTALTFEQGYGRLQEISQRVTSEDVPVAEMCELFAEGKGLEKALTEYLDQQKSRVEDIERGKGVQAFRITAPSDGQNTDVVDASDFDSAAAAGTDFDCASPPPKPTAYDEDIPF